MYQPNFSNQPGFDSRLFIYVLLFLGSIGVSLVIAAVGFWKLDKFFDDTDIQMEQLDRSAKFKLAMLPVITAFSGAAASYTTVTRSRGSVGLTQFSVGIFSFWVYTTATLIASLTDLIDGIRYDSPVYDDFHETLDSVRLCLIFGVMTAVAFLFLNLVFCFVFNMVNRNPVSILERFLLFFVEAFLAIGVVIGISRTADDEFSTGGEIGVLAAITFGATAIVVTPFMIISHPSYGFHSWYVAFGGASFFMCLESNLNGPVRTTELNVATAFVCLGLLLASGFSIMKVWVDDSKRYHALTEPLKPLE